MAAEPPSLHAVPSGRGGAPSAAIFTRSAKWEGGCPLPLGGLGALPPKMLEFLRPQGAFWAISGQFGFLF